MLWVDDDTETVLDLMGCGDDGRLILAAEHEVLRLEPSDLVVLFRPVIPGYRAPGWLAGVDSPPAVRANPEFPSPGIDAGQEATVLEGDIGGGDSTADVAHGVAHDDSQDVDEPVDEWDIPDPDPTDASYPDWSG